MKVSSKKVEELKKWLFKEGRLIDRIIFGYLFEDKDKQEVMRALKAYQNSDGGFGNGLEEDILVPASTGIASETALTMMDLIDYKDEKTLSELKSWVEKNVTELGVLLHPPKEVEGYPCQSWWNRPDDIRILSIVGLLMKLDVAIDEAVLEKVNAYASTIQLGDKIEIYDYPIYVFAMYNKTFSKRDEIINHFKQRVDRMVEDHAKHNPFVSRYWSILDEMIPPEVFEAEANRFLDNLNDAGHVEEIYDFLPHWKYIFTLDGYMVLNKKTTFLDKSNFGR